VGPVRGPERPGTADEPDDIETWYRRPCRRRRRRRLAIAAALVTAAAVTWTAVGGWQAGALQYRPGPRPLRLADAPRGVIVLARDRQHRRRQRIVLISAPFIGAGAGLAARDGRRWLQRTGQGSHDPKKTGTHPRRPAIAAGVGSYTTQNLFDQFNIDYNQSRASTPNQSIATPPPSLDTWDAATSPTGQSGGLITEKPGCAAVPRPNGPGAGIPQLASSMLSTSGQDCTDFATSPRWRQPTDPPFAAGGVAFVTLAGDGVTWSTQTITDAPTSLTVAQLRAIYTCIDTNWSQVGGKNAPIQPVLPQSDSGTQTFWLAAIGVTTPGPCVNSLNNTLEENEGVNSVLSSPQVIFPYSIGDYIDQKYHSAPCLTSACTASSNGLACIPAHGMNQMGCDVHGTMALGEIDGAAPTTGSGPATVINLAFPSAFSQTLYEVVPYDPSTPDHIPGAEPGAPGGVDLESIFGASGWACTRPTAKKDIQAYGFINLPTCGSTS
jgi:ABC-type phosphate transport system substrate-binding protein